MHNVPIYILQAVVTHTTKQEPTANVRILVNGQWVQTLTTSIDVECGEMAGEFAAILGDQAPFREFFLLGPFNVQSADFVPSEFEPEHVVRQIQHQVVLL